MAKPWPERPMSPYRMETGNMCGKDRRLTTHPTPGRTMAQVSMHDDGDGIGLTAAPTALPSVLARALAFGAIVVAAVCGGLAGYATSALQCSGGCVGPALGGTAIGALAAAAGVAALAALVLRSMSEWADQASVQLRKKGARR